MQKCFDNGEMVSDDDFVKAVNEIENDKKFGKMLDYASNGRNSIDEDF